MTKSNCYSLIVLTLLGIIFYSNSENLYAALRDPTKPPNFSQQSTPITGNLEVNAIIISHHSRFAIINGITVKPGDMIANSKVIEIEPNAVHLAGADGNITLVLIDPHFINTIAKDPRKGIVKHAGSE